MSAASTPRAAPPSLHWIGWACLLLGFGLGGFFDGIVLHQILQWHHLLSDVYPDETVMDLRLQILADGFFHVATYALTVVGLWQLWRARAALARSGARRRVIAAGLVGFGAWHVADAVLFHWTLGLHRIRMEAENLLLWDVLWLVPFGLAPVALGCRLHARPPSGPSGGGRPAALALALAAMLAGPVALRPPADAVEDRALAVFWPWMSFPAIVAAAEAAGGSPVWSDASGGVWLIVLKPGARAERLYRNGAIMVSGGPLALGCLSWSRI